MSSKRQNPNERIDESIARAAKAVRLSSPTALIGEVKVPTDIFAALATGRPELLRLMGPRDFTGNDAREVLNLIVVLIETNMALAEHCKEIGHVVDSWNSGMRGLVASGDRIRRLAHFDSNVTNEEETEEEAAAA